MSAAIAPGRSRAENENATIQLEDIYLCEAVQRALHSRTYTSGRYSVKRENGVHHFHSLLAKFYLPE
jgi:hypothetical protein